MDGLKVEGLPILPIGNTSSAITCSSVPLVERRGGYVIGIQRDDPAISDAAVNAASGAGSGDGSEPCERLRLQS